MALENLTAFAQEKPKQNWELAEFNSLLPNLSASEREKMNKCTILIGGTPFQPNSRLLSYLAPAALLIKSITKKFSQVEPEVILSSTSAGGARWNYLGRENEILKMTDIKLEMGIMGLERFFQVKAQAYNATYNITDLPHDLALRRTWLEAKRADPLACNQYLNQVLRYLNDEQDETAAPLYGVMHAIWAGDIEVEGINPPHPIEEPSLSFGGAKEAAFNQVRQAVTQIDPVILTEILQRQVRVREQIFRVADPNYKLPVPYGEMTAKLIGNNEGPVDVRLVGTVEIGGHKIDYDQQGPFEVPKPDRQCSRLVLSDLHKMTRLIADNNGLSGDQAEKEYEDFWRECQVKFRNRIYRILRNE